MSRLCLTAGAVVLVLAAADAPEDLSKLAPFVDRVQAVQIGGLATLLGGRAVGP